MNTCVVSVFACLLRLFVCVVQLLSTGDFPDLDDEEDLHWWSFSSLLSLFSVESISAGWPNALFA